MDWKPLKEIPTVQVAELEDFTDDRGSLIEFWRNDELRFQSASYRPAMGYLSWTYNRQIRGPHEHKDQTDLFVFAGPGAFALYLWTYVRSEGTGDVHPDVQVIIPVGDPETYVKEERVRYADLGCRRLAVLVPPGVVHGYKCVTKVPGLLINIPNRLYRGLQKKRDVDEIRWEENPDSPFKIPE